MCTCTTLVLAREGSAMVINEVSIMLEMEDAIYHAVKGDTKYRYFLSKSMCVVECK